MNLIASSVNTVFGHLYIAVFSNGTVKAGMAKTNPQNRVTTHALSGKAFGIRLETAFYALIYTDDTRARERLMHEEIGKLAVPTAGREWFTFSNVDAALNFASSYCCRVERMSFSERPSPQQIVERKAKFDAEFNNRWDAIYPKQEPNLRAFRALTAEETQDIELTMKGLKLDTVVALARKLKDAEDRLALTDENFDSGLPILNIAIDTYLDQAISKAEDPRNLQSRCRALEIMSFDQAISIIKAAACYPNFFFQSLKAREVAV